MFSFNLSETWFTVEARPDICRIDYSIKLEDIAANRCNAQC